MGSWQCHPPTHGLCHGVIREESALILEARDPRGLRRQDTEFPTELTRLNLAWHISGEIRQYLSGHGYNGPVVDVLSSDDFHA